MRIAARLAAQAPMQDAPERRAAPRVAVRAPATMRALGYHGTDVLVRDISGEGFRAETRARFMPGSYVRLRIPGLGALHARIVWAKDDQVGGAFVNPVEPGRLNRIIGLGAA